MASFTRGAATTGTPAAEAKPRAGHEPATAFAVSASCTIDAPAADVYTAWTDAKRRARWLDSPAPAIRRATTNRSLRLVWADGTAADVVFAPKGTARTRLTVNHRRLRDAAEVERLAAIWTRRLDALQRLLES
jgi:hypothetical protein